MAVNPAGELESLTHQLEELNRIGAALSAERDTARLLELILTKARDITVSDAGSIYIVESITDPPADVKGPTEPDRRHPEAVRRLRFSIAQNASVDLPFRQSLL